MLVHFWTSGTDRVMDFFTGTLGFTVAHAQPEGGPFDFCILKLEDQEVLFGAPPEDLITQDRNDRPLLETVRDRIGQGGPLSVYFAVGDIDAHYQTATRLGVTVLEPLWLTPWGLKQYSVSDPDGNLLTFHNR